MADNETPIDLTASDSTVSIDARVFTELENQIISNGAKILTELEIQTILDEVSLPINEIVRIPCTSTETIKQPNSGGPIDYCEWCGWSDYMETFSLHADNCKWKLEGRCKPTYPRDVTMGRNNGGYERLAVKGK